MPGAIFPRLRLGDARIVSPDIVVGRQDIEVGGLSRNDRFPGLFRDR
jgi:hypothetical protein